MSLISNTRMLLTRQADADPKPLRVEYHLLSWRELYDKSIITADRYTSGAGEWVIQGGRDLYNVNVVSYPYYALPQELCLTFDCYSEERNAAQGTFTVIGPPTEWVASEFAVLLSVFAREAILLLGLRRIEGRPKTEKPYHVHMPRLDRPRKPVPLGINSPEFVTLLKGLARADNSIAAAILGAAKYYHAGLSLISFDPSVAYVLLVSAIECLAGHHCKNLVFDFSEVQKFKKVRGLLDRVTKLPDGQELVEEIKSELLSSEHFLRNKFVRFVEEYLPKEFWEIPDELHQEAAGMPQIERVHLGSYLRKVYDARSNSIHLGTPFPSYIDYGMRARVPVETLGALMELQNQQRYTPTFAWFERLTHYVIIEYMRQSCCADLVEIQKRRAAEKERLIYVIGGLSENVRSSLQKLTEWTARFLGFAIINPHAPNRDWADVSETVEILLQAGIIEYTGTSLDDQAWLKNREVGEAVGEFFFGVDANPFRGNELLLPENYDLLFEKD